MPKGESEATAASTSGKTPCANVTPKLELRHVSQRYTGARGETLALDGMDLRVAPGESVAILGPSGCGKSTSLLAACGLQRPTGGSVFVSIDWSSRAFVAPVTTRLSTSTCDSVSTISEQSHFNDLNVEFFEKITVMPVNPKSTTFWTAKTTSWSVPKAKSSKAVYEHLDLILKGEFGTVSVM